MRLYLALSQLRGRVPLARRTIPVFILLRGRERHRRTLRKVERRLLAEMQKRPVRNMMLHVRGFTATGIRGKRNRVDKSIAAMPRPLRLRRRHERISRRRGVHQLFRQPRFRRRRYRRRRDRASDARCRPSGVPGLEILLRLLEQGLVAGADPRAIHRMSAKNHTTPPAALGSSVFDNFQKTARLGCFPCPVARANYNFIDREMNSEHGDERFRCVTAVCQSP
jgi:hypothetical protein